MRVAHVVTYISVDGAFGGPVAVAIGQAQELAARGHEVVLIAGWDGQAAIEAPGVEVRLFRVTRIGKGFSGVISLRLLSDLRRRASGFDAIHVHLARDMVALPAALLALNRRVPLFVQTHGMIMPDSRYLVRLVDRLATTRILRRCVTAFALTATESDGLAAVGRSTKIAVHRIANGVKSSGREGRESPREAPRVLFLARLHPRKRVVAFAEAGKILLDKGTPAHFVVVGPDEGDLPALQHFISENGLTRSMRYDGPVSPGRGRSIISEADVFVLPSRGEVFPMTILEALSVDTPVVMTDDCGISPELKSRGAVLSTDGSPHQLAAAIRRVLDDAALRMSMIENGRRAIKEWLSIEAVVDDLEAAYGSPSFVRADE